MTGGGMAMVLLRLLSFESVATSLKNTQMCMIRAMAASVVISCGLFTPSAGVAAAGSSKMIGALDPV